MCMLEADNVGFNSRKSCAMNEIGSHCKFSTGGMCFNRTALAARLMVMLM